MFSISTIINHSTTLAVLLLLVLIPLWKDRKFTGKIFWTAISVFFVCYVGLKPIIDHYFYPFTWELPYIKYDFELWSEEFWDFSFSDDYDEIMSKNFFHYLSRILIKIYGITWRFIAYAFCYFVVKTQLSKFINLCFFIYSCMIFLSVAHLTAHGIYLKYIADYEYDSGIYSIFGVIVSILCVFICLLFLMKYVKPNVIKGTIPAYKHLWIISLIFLLVMEIFHTSSIYGLIDLNIFFFLALLLMAGLFFVTYFVIKMVIQTENNAQLNLNLVFAERQIELQGENYVQLQSFINETKRARHDLRHHLSAIQSMLNTDEKEKLADYINRYIASLPDDTEIIFCKNFAVNSLLQYYIGLARNENIYVDAKLHLPEDTGISDTDFCIIFGNSIENAIEACRKVSGEKFIKINSRPQGKMLMITIDNSFNGELIRKGDKLMSTKHEGEGLGTSSIKGVVQKYNGTAGFSATENVFQVSIVLICVS